MANAPSLRSSVPLAHPETIALLLQLGAPQLTAIEGETILGSSRRYKAAAARNTSASAPPEDPQFQALMKSVSAANTSLKEAVLAGAHPDAAKESQKLEAIFKDVQTFFVKRNATDPAALAERYEHGGTRTYQWRRPREMATVKTRRSKS